MRWDLKKKDSTEVGTKKLVHKFLWFPVHLGDEIRWLERATIEYEWMHYTQLAVEICEGIDVVGWVKIRFIDDPLFSKPDVSPGKLNWSGPETVLLNNGEDNV